MVCITCPQNWPGVPHKEAPAAVNGAALHTQGRKAAGRRAGAGRLAASAESGVHAVHESVFGVDTGPGRACGADRGACGRNNPDRDRRGHVAGHAPDTESGRRHSAGAGRLLHKARRPDEKPF